MKSRNAFTERLGKQRVARRITALAISTLLCSAGMTLLLPGTAYAYLDPGTGSMLLSAAIGIAATVFFMVKTFYYKAASLFFRLTGSAPPRNGKDAIVFYSEGRQYWSTFKPVLEALDSMGVEAAYLTSGADDPGLNHNFTHIMARHIGTGNRAFAAMNMLEASVCVMTTPGLDVLQIRRSPGVAHYAHLVHAPTDCAIYKPFSFDCFDSVLCSGPHQIKTLRYLEELRGTTPKILLHTGCLYMDVLADELERSKTALPATTPGSPNGKPRVLVAPTWGTNGLLRRFGLDILRPMAEAGFMVTVRPHPQSREREADLLTRLETALAPYPNVSWDRETSAFRAMIHSDVLLSDLSGIVFDYAFVLERPVITVTMDVDTRGLEAADLPYPAWELEKLSDLGASISPQNVGRLPEVIASFPPTWDFAERMRNLRGESLFNYRAGGTIAARQITDLRDGLCGNGNKA